MLSKQSFSPPYVLWNIYIIFFCGGGFFHLFLQHIWTRILVHILKNILGEKTFFHLVHISINIFGQEYLFTYWKTYSEKKHLLTLFLPLLATFLQWWKARLIAGRQSKRSPTFKTWLSWSWSSCSPMTIIIMFTHDHDGYQTGRPREHQHHDWEGEDHVHCHHYHHHHQ